MKAHRVLRGANIHADHPVWLMALEHGIAAESIGNVAIELQQRVGLGANGVATWSDDDATWVAYGYVDEEAGREAGRQAVRHGEVTPEGIAAVQAALDEHAPPESVEAILRAARGRNIPIIERGPTYQLGWGIKQQRLLGTLTSRTAGLGYDIANDHERMTALLDQVGIRCPRSDSRRTLEGVRELADELRYPVTIKPLRGRGGVTHLESDAELEAAYDKAKQYHRWIVVQDFMAGDRFTALVVRDQLIGVVQGDTDVTETVHPSISLACRRAARLAGIDIVGVDLRARTLEQPLDDTRGAIVSLNPEPDLSPFPSAPDAILDTMFDDDGRIPLVAVTGTNGKTTTVRLISHILKYAGGRVGMACTGAIEVENHVAMRGDYSGPLAAKTVLQEPGVTHAVCEVARGGMLRRGIGFDQCDAAALLNVGSDHLGSHGIETVEDLAKLKAVLLKTIRPGGSAIINADDDLAWAHVPEGNVIPFSLDPSNPRLREYDVHVTRVDGDIVLRKGNATFQVATIAHMPITLDGAALFNVQNAMAATGLAYAIGVSEEDCRAGLMSFNPSMNQLPGRMNLLRLGGVKVLIDYGHNVPALAALAEVLPRLATGKKINVANASGNRRDEDLLEFGTTIAGMYDRIFLCDPDPRGREVGETSSIIRKGIEAANFEAENLVMEMDERKALRLALAESRPNDLVVLQADDVEGAIALVKELQAQLESGKTAEDINRELIEA